ncbi:MAG: hypothetical protein FWF92_02165 [Oscillospiraceae bacterium]|nr:hypothetical protein [Oscillospiraceae bacterium]
MKKRKIVCLLLAILIFVLPAASCADKNDNGNSNPTNPVNPNANANENENENGENNPEIPQNTKNPDYTSDLGEEDFGGYEFHVMGRYIDDPVGSWNTWEIYAENEDGTLINDAVYLRNRILEDRYNISIKQTLMFNSLLSPVRKAVASGEEYDLVLPPQRESAMLATDGLLTDLKTVPNLNLTKAYWNQNLEKYTAINNKVFFCTGDINIMDKQATYVFYFNKELAANLALENPYNMVREGKWTMEAFNSMLKDVTVDLNGDGKFDKNDQYGIVLYGGLGIFNYYAGESIVTKTASGGLEITFNNERTLRAIDNGIEILKGNQAYSAKGWEEGQNMFQDGQGLFYMEVLDKTGQLRGMEVPFGVLPPPKLDELQPQYHTIIHDHGQFFCIPVNTPDVARTGFILEALAEGSTDTLKNAYYDLNLTTKFVRDDDSVEMIELIMQGIIFDIGAIYGLGNMNNIVDNSIKKGENNFVSDYEKNEEKANATLQKFIDAFS